MAQKIISTKQSAFWAYLGTATSMLSSFAILPLNFLFLNSKEIGFWYILMSVSNLVILFDFGFDPSFARNIAYVWSGAKHLKTVGAESVEEDVNTDFVFLGKIISVARVTYLCIAALVTFFLLSLGTVYVDKVIFNQLSGQIYWTAWFIFCFSMFVNMYYGYMSALLRGVGKIVEVNKAIFASRLIQIVISIVFFLMGFGIIAPVIGLLSYGILFRMFCRKSFYSDEIISKSKSVIEERAGFDDVKVIMSSIWPNTWRDGLVGISNYLTTQGTSLIAASFLPLSVVGTYSIGVQFANGISLGASALNGAIHPVLQSAFVREDFHTMRAVISRAISIYILLSGAGFFVAYFVAFPVLRMFKSTSMPSVMMFFLLWLYYLLFQFQSTHAAFISDMNQVPYVKAFVITSVSYTLLLPLILFFSSANVYVMILSSIFAQSVYNLWKWPGVLYRQIGTNFFDMLCFGFKQLKNQLIRIGQ